MEPSSRGLLRRTALVLLPTGGIVVGGVFGWTGLGIALGLAGAASVTVGAARLSSMNVEPGSDQGADEDRPGPAARSILHDHRRATAWVLVGSALEFIALVAILLGR